MQYGKRKMGFHPPHVKFPQLTVTKSLMNRMENGQKYMA